MISLTEDEAKQRWCPFTRVLSHTSAQDGKGRFFEGGYSYNRTPDDQEQYFGPSSKCIGSACMAWRQGQKRNPAWMPRNHMMHYMEQHPDEVQPSHIPDPERGCCGLAGRPS